MKSKDLSAPLLTISKRLSVIAEAEKAIRQAIVSHTFIQQLPSERDLSEQLGVSRATVRAALGNLQKTGLIQIEHGRKTQIVLNSENRSKKPQRQIRRDVVLLSLTPHFPLDSGAPWIEELRRLLYLRGYTLVTEFCPGDRGINARLGELTARYRSALWILQSCSERIYTWFSKNQIPAIVSGVPHEGVVLPSICVDLYAVCRHAVGLLLSKGHRRIGLVAPKIMLPGDLQSFHGFQAGLAAHREKNAEGVVLYYQTDAASIYSNLKRELAKPDHATAFVVCRPSAVMGVVSALAAMDLSVPDNISIICRDYSPSVLAAIWPPLGHYYCDPTKIAKKFVSALLALESGFSFQKPNLFIIPEYIEGSSVRAVL